MQPDVVNFETLASVYGVIGGTRPPAVPAGGSAAAADADAISTPPSTNDQPGTTFQEQDEKDEKDKEKDEEDRRLRTRTGLEQEADLREDFPASVRRRMEEIDAVVYGNVRVGRGWRMLHESRNGRALEMDLGEGYKVQLHFLLATDEDYHHY